LVVVAVKDPLSKPQVVFVDSLETQLPVDIKISKYGVCGDGLRHASVIPIVYVPPVNKFVV
jgi:hypothetical protein